MPLYTSKGRLLLNNDKLANNEDCCCIIDKILVRGGSCGSDTPPDGTKTACTNAFPNASDNTFVEHLRGESSTDEWSVSPEETNVRFTYWTGSIADRFKVVINGNVVLDTGLSSITTVTSQTFLKPQGVTVIRVEANPVEGEGQRPTGWMYSLEDISL